MLDPRLVDIVSRNLGIDATEVTPETGPEAVPQWDSLGHLKLILEVEECFAVRFPAARIAQLTTVGRIQQALDGLAAGRL